MSAPQFYPALNKLIDSDSIPEPIKSGIDNIFSKLFYKSYYVEKSVQGDIAYHHLILVFNKVGLNLFGGAEGFEIIFNPGSVANTTELPLSLYYNIPILKYVNKIKLEDLSTVEDYFDLILEMFNISKEDLLFEAVLTFLGGNENPAQTFIDAFNNNPDYNSYTPLTLPVGSGNFEEDYSIVESLITQFEDNNLDIRDYLLENYLNASDITQGFGSLSLLFKRWMGEFSMHTLIDLFIPKFSVSIEVLEIALAFPRTWLKPVDPVSFEVIDDVTVKSMLIYNVGSVTYNSKTGFEFVNPNNFDLTLSQIGNTGLIIEIDDLKLDFKSDRNIPEADADGRPNDFKGIYAENATIILPKKWFKAENGATLKIAATNFLAGTEGGFSGKVALMPLVAGNPISETDIMWFKLGSDESKSWRLGFKSFDVKFKQNQVVNSHLHALLELKKFKKPAESTTALIDLYGEWESQENFKLSASFLPNGLPLNLFNLLTITFQTAEVGKEDGDFFIGADTKLSFPEGTLANSLFNNQVINLPAIRFYFDGRFEVVGGNAFIPVNFTLPLFGDTDEDGKGNFEMSVTGIHLGSIQRERNGKNRKYNYIGFDGGISIDPIGIDLRGKGVKYYYTTDSDEIYEEYGVTEGHDEEYYRDSYFHISTLELDLIIPGNAQPKDALAIIKGSLTIPEPGVSTEYSGKISIQIPKGNIYGEAAMRLDPKTPAYLINAHVEFPNGIPLGPVAINGFKGLLGQRYVAEKRAIGMGEENTWYEYYMAPQKGINVDKFSGPELTKDYESAFSIGLGAKISTNDGGGRIASLRAMMLLSTPSMFAIDAGLTILSERLGLAEEDPTNPPFYAFVIIGDDALELGAGAKFQLNKSNGYLLDIKAELQAGFFFKNQRPWYINFGTPQQPIVAKLFKGVIGINAYSYLMIAARGIEAGARASFQFNFVIAKFKASVEVGAYISFERPQIGAYALLQGSIRIKFGPFKLTAELKVYLAVEMPKPFLIFAEFRLRVCARISFVRVCIRLKFTLKWKKNNTMVYTPIPPLSYQNIADEDFAKIEQHLRRVKGVNMLTYEEFDLHFLGVNLLSPPDANSIDKIIPLDTYVDIKVEKGLDPMALQAYKIGGHTGGAANFVDLIPPKRQLKGGKTIRQVKHKYSINSLEIFAWVDPLGSSAGSWVPYHPFKAILPNRPVENLKIGYWQRTGKQYDTIRLLATNPFSFLDGAEPGWFIPEQYGITPSELFCTSSEQEWNCANVLNYSLNSVYSPDNDPNFAYNFNGAYFSLSGPHEEVVDPLSGEVIGGSFGDLIVQDIPNPHNFQKSLAFRNSEKLIIKLPEPSVRIKLKITTNSQGVTLNYYRTAINDNSMFQTYELIESVYKTATDLQVEIEFDNETNHDPLRSVFKIEIIPDFPNQDQILAIETQMEELWVNSQEAADGPTVSVLSPADQMLYDQLNLQLNQLKAIGCSGNIGGSPCNKDELLCSFYNDIKNLHTTCFLPLTIETVYNYCNELDCFQDFIVKIKDFNYQNPVYNLLDGPLNSLYDECLVHFDQLMAWCQNQNNNLEEVFNYYTAFVNIASECLVVIENIGNCDCNGTNPCNEDVLLCELYDYLQNLIETCFSPLSVNGVYDYCDELECFYSFIKKIRVFDEEHPEYQILQGNILSLHDSYIQHYIQLKDWCANNNSDLIEVFQYYSSFVEIATSLANTVGDIGHCNCGEVQPCQKDPILCDLYTQLLGLFNNCFITLTANEEYLYCQELNCFSEFINLIKIFNEQYSEYALVANHLHDEYEQYNQQYGQLISWCSNPVTDASIVIDFYESFVANASNILSIIKDLGNCDCIEASGLSCTTSFQQVCWKTVQHYEYSQTIPSQAAVEEDTQAMIAGINTTAQPIWRPNTKYYIKFSLKDEVDNGQRPSGIFDYYYGFRTVGPVGHFHKYPNAYPIPDTVIIDGVSIKQSEVEFPLTSLRKYIDYNRSYPNADGNIILAKPLFYGNEQCKIDIYFEKPFAYHMLKTWQSYNGLPELKGAMHIAIKDPVSNTIIPYPLPQDWELNEYVPETILNGDNGWVSDEIPRYPVNIQLLIDYVNSVNANPNSIQCSINLGDLIKPASYIYSVTLTNLKPRKLYTALVYNAFDENGDGLFENQLDENNGIVYEESQKVHEFVFQTSRYQTFRDQVESYLLKEFDENNNLINEKQAVYEQRLALNLNQIENALALVSGGNTPETLAMETRFYHPFDRVIEGVFGIKPIDPAVTTDFIRIVDQNTGKLVALIIRNPEPFNNPRIPLNEIIDTVYVHLKLSEYPDTDYKVLYSKDYSQMIVMHVSKEIVRTSLRILFKYKVWDGSNYIVPDESSIPNDEKIYTIKKVIQIKQN